MSENPMAFADDITIDVPAVVLRITHQFEPDLSEAELYERTRGYWVMQPHEHPNVVYAFALASDVIREAYRIDSWQRLHSPEIPPNPLRRPDHDHSSSRAEYRWEFTGSVAPEDVRTRFVGKRYRAQARNPVLWINC